MKKFLLTCSALVFVLYAWAQERVVSGKVASAEDASPLPGVNVVVKGTTNGTVTDAGGAYSLSVTGAEPTLVFSFIGLATQEVAVGQRTAVDVSMALDVTQLTEVVVTAQGVEREQKALGYATTTISSAALSNKPETDVGRALQGRTPGLQILNSSGLAGSGSVSISAVTALSPVIHNHSGLLTACLSTRNQTTSTLTSATVRWHQPVFWILIQTTLSPSPFCVA